MGSSEQIVLHLIINGDNINETPSNDLTYDKDENLPHINYSSIGSSRRQRY